MATGGMRDAEKGTDKTFDFLCLMCQGQNKNAGGEHFCADCSDYYCSSCIKVHNAVTALKNHKILNKAQLKSSSSIQFPAVPTERCREQGHKPVDMFCQQHDSVGCATCMVVQNSNCQDKFYVPDFIKNRYNVKVKSDREACYIYSACTLPNGTIILADYSNSKLKRLDSSSYAVKDNCDVPNKPWQVCPITDNEVAVSCPSSKIIQFVSVGRTMKKTRKISTEFSCVGLAYADERLFVSDWNTSVYVYTVSGATQQQFSKDHSGQQIFSGLSSIAVSSDHSKIYVADYKKGLIILDRTGQDLGEFDGPELKGASGICLDKNDSVLVCGYVSKNVVQLSPDGKLLGEVLKTDTHCHTVSCNKDSTKLIVGLESTDEIEVYSIKLCTNMKTTSRNIT